MAYHGWNALTPFGDYDESKPALPRGKRGYHKYENGLLNVTPIEEKSEVVEQNTRKSPLLRLPPEIRTTIWEFTIAGNIIRPNSKNISLNNTAGYVRPPPHRFSLIRVSRQVYFEAAILVWKSSTFRFRDYSDIAAWRHPPYGKTFGADGAHRMQEALNSAATRYMNGKTSIEPSVVVLPTTKGWRDIFKKGTQDHR